MKIDFNRLCLIGNELEYIKQAIENAHISGDGLFTKKIHAYLEKELKVKKTLMTTSCTHALEMAALLLNIQANDEVIIPSFTFVSTANAFTLHGAKPVFIDCRSDTLNMDENLLERLITPQTRAIVPVHYAGVGCEMRRIMEIANHHHIPVIEDNAHGFFGKYHGKYLGTFGSLATTSFHETKGITCGEGGALFINDPQYIDRAEIIREKGTNRSRFYRGLVDKYSWVDVGSSYLPSDMLAAFLYAQIEKWNIIQKKRQKIWNNYYNGLVHWAEKHGVKLPVVPKECDHPYHMFYMLIPTLKQRTDFINYLKSKEILSVFHYLPLHTSEMGRKFGGNPGDCPVTEQVSDQLVRLPFYYSLTEDDQNKIIVAITAYDLN